MQGQMKRVYDAMKDGQWRTIEEMVAAIRKDGLGPVTTTGAAANLRDLRKEKHGGYNVGRRTRGPGEHRLYEFRLNVGKP